AIPAAVLLCCTPRGAGPHRPARGHRRRRSPTSPACRSVHPWIMHDALLSLVERDQFRLGQDLGPDPVVGQDWDHIPRPGWGPSPAALAYRRALSPTGSSPSMIGRSSSEPPPPARGL